MNTQEDTLMNTKKNPYKEGTRSWKIWDKNNNPDGEMFWKDKFTRKTTKIDEKLMMEALAKW